MWRALHTRSRGQQGQLTQVQRTRPPNAPARVRALSSLQREERLVGGESSLARVGCHLRRGSERAGFPSHFNGAPLTP